MNTYYLILQQHRDEKPIIIKKCRAGSKLVAAIIFADRLNTFIKSTLYTSRELVSSIKRENELTGKEKQWIKEEDVELLEL